MFCGSGVWSDGDVTICFQDCVLQPILVGSFAIIFMLRIIRVLQLPPRNSQTVMPSVQQANLAFSAAIVFCRAAVLCLDAIEGSNFHACVDVGDVTALVSWILVTIVIWIQSVHGKRPGRLERLWWMLSFAVAVVRFRTDIEALKGHEGSDREHCDSRALCTASLLVRMVVFGLQTVMAMFGVFQRDTRSLDYKSKSGASSVRSNLVAGSGGSLGNPTKYGAIRDEVDVPIVEPDSDSNNNTDTTDNHKRKVNNNRQCGLAEASLWERLTFSWINPLLELGAATPLDHQHLYSLPPDDLCGVSFDTMRLAWSRFSRGRPRHKTSLFRAFLSAFGPYFFVTGLFKVVNDVSIFAGPLLLKAIVSFLDHHNSPAWHGYAYAAGLFLCNEVQSVALGQYFFRGLRLGLRVRAAVCSLVYSKSLHLSYASRARFGIGRIVSLMQIDAQKICDAVPYLHLTWSAPFQLAVALYLLHDEVGLSTFAGLGVLIVLMPLNAFVGRKQAFLTRKTMEARDKRVKLVNEVVSGVRIVKMFGWEHSFLQQVKELRDTEMAFVRKNALWGALSSFMWAGTPLFVSVATFGTFVALGNTLTASRAFTSLALFNVLRFPLNALPSAVTQWIDVAVSNKRLWEFLIAEEFQEEIVHDSLTQNASTTSTSPRPNGHAASIRSSVSADHDDSSSAITPTPRYFRILSPQFTPRPCVLGPNEAIRVVSASFAWPVAQQQQQQQEKGKGKGKNAQNLPPPLTEKLSVLSNVEFVVPQGALVCVVGAVGSGKSTLLDGLLGEVPCEPNGQVWVRGRIAFCAQQAWIQNATVRENILFGRDMDTIRYTRVIEACALTEDLRILPSGDETEIGERGINLSGGQKQRVALARACYSQADTFILDDVLSAVDVHVGKHIVNNCLTGLLKGKTRVVATHQIQWLPLADLVIVLKDGSVFAQGKYSDLVDKGIDFGPLALTKETAVEADTEPAAAKPAAAKKEPSMTATAHGHGHGHGHARAESPVKEKKKDPAAKDTKSEKGRLIKDEERETGIVSLRIWKVYAAALGAAVFAVLCSMYGMAQGLQVLSNVWLADWSDDRGHYSAWFYLAIYSGLSLVAAVFVYLRVLVLALASVRAGKRIHDQVLWAVLRSPTAFFDATPLGRILNRLSQDQQTVDVSMRQNTQMLLNSLAMLVGAMVSILYATPYVAVAIVPVAFIYFRVQHYYRASARELQRLDSISKSPVYVCFSESVSGSSSIRAFRKIHEFCQDNQARVDKNLRAALPAYVSNRWLAIRLEFLGSMIVGIAASISVFEHESRGMAAGLAGLSLTYALEVTNILNWLIRMFTTTELQMVSVERLMQWEKLEPEAPLTIASNPIPQGWPAQGRVVFENVQMRYRPDLDYVLRGVSFSVSPGMRVGIVGRTGSGKSSLLVSLFRLVEIESSGSIMIDGINTRSIGLHDLRKHISIIPQDPILFSGTLRRNLDPFHEHSDEDLWTALDQCFMRTYVESRDKQLDMMIEPGGENLSVGQRQLVCLGRALLRRSKILVLDEATASIDGETDVLIQKSLKDNLVGCTVLTIAHRIHTVQTSDLIIVMDNGLAREIGRPGDLMQNPEGLFYKLVTGGESSSATKSDPVEV